MKAHTLLLALVGFFGLSCDVHDFRGMEETLVVDSQQPRDGSWAFFQHEKITRHSIDFYIQTSQEGGTEVVVRGASYVGGEERAVAYTVNRFNDGLEGRLSDIELEMGDTLGVWLECCSESRCAPVDVMCPEQSTGSEELFCYEACSDTSSCLEACPAAGTCGEDCEESLCAESCEPSWPLLACAEGALDCEPDGDCVQLCEEAASSCFANCLAVVYRCREERAPSITGDEELPCGLCDGEGLCSVLSMNQELALETADGAQISCSPDCASYPIACVQNCRELNAGYDCASDCVRVFQRVCGKDANSIELNSEVPCCFGESCQAEMRAVAQFEEVECYSSEDCGSGRECEDRGVCRATAQEEGVGCSISRRSSGHAGGGLLWVLLLYGLRKRYGSRSSA